MKRPKRYFIRTNLYKYLTENGDLERAMVNSEKIVPVMSRVAGGFEGILGDTKSDRITKSNKAIIYP